MNHLDRGQAPEEDQQAAAEGAVAIIGIACEFPGVENFGALWDVLAHGRETITHFTDAQLEAAGVRPDRLSAPNYVKSKGVLRNVEHFDHALFGIEADRALLMDPQHRVFIQKCWEALEDAGYDPHRHNAPIGLFAGCALNTYVLNNLRHADRALSRKFSSIEFLLMTDKDFLTTQTSYLLGLTGPSVTVQTACSTSITAMHYACESIASGESDMALAGAVTVYAPQVKGYLYEPDSIISPDGHVRSFDARGGGTVYSSGVGVVLLKSLQQARADNDQIYAVIRSTAINNDGARKAAFKMPSAQGIADVARDALALAQVPVQSIGMIEANGSGTAFGDPIEVEALTRAYGGHDIPAASIPIGSIKSNIGHMNVTAGMGAVLKTVAALRAGQVPPSINFEQPNPRIQFEKSPLHVCSKLMDWPVEGYPRRAGVNVYGVGGTNGHAILEQAPHEQGHRSGRSAHLFTLAAATPTALGELVTRLGTHLAGHRKLDLGDVAFSLNRGRQQLTHRAIAVVTADSISERIPMQRLGTAPSHRTSACLVLTGSQGRDVQEVLQALDACPTFSQHFEQVAAFMPELVAALHEWRCGNTAVMNEHSQQCLVLATDVALGRLLLDTGLSITAIFGGVLPLAAMALSGVISLHAMAELHRVIAASTSSQCESAVRAALSELGLNSQAVPLYSPISGQLHPGNQAIDVDHVVKLLLLEANSDLIRSAEGAMACAFVSIGASKVLDAASIAHSVTPVGSAIAALPSLLDAAGALWVAGADLDLAVYYQGDGRGRVSLPTYPFARHRHWVDIPVEAKPCNYDVAL